MQEQPYIPEKMYSTGARMPGVLRNKLARMAESEGRMCSESEMIRLLIERAQEPRRRQARRLRAA
jgi:Arc/MetJ-type ribon-helix-helix transcriptional regulator